MVAREEVEVEMLTPKGWYRGYITMPAGGRLLDYLNAKPEVIAMGHVVDPSGGRHSFVAINTEQVLAVRPQALEDLGFDG